MLVGFEGVDAAGKTTQVRLLEQRLASLGIPVTVLIEKEHTILGHLALVERRLTDPLAAYLATVASKAELAALIRHHHPGKVIILDRFVPSLLAYAPECVYQNKPLYYAIRRCVKPGLAFPKVDLCVLLTTTYEQYLNKHQGDEIDLTEEKFHKILHRYRGATYGSSRCRLKIDTSKMSMEDTHEKIFQTVMRLLNTKEPNGGPKDAADSQPTDDPGVPGMCESALVDASGRDTLD